MKTEFYKLLEDAVTDDTALVLIINKIMPMIENTSKINNEIDEDLKSVLITYTIEIIRKKQIYKIF